MKKRTNLLALVLSITAITFTLFGCSSDTGQKKSIAAPGNATETGGGAESSGTNGDGADQASADESINEQVLVDQDGIKITATEYVTDSIWGDGIKLLVENNSAKDYTIGCDALIVNDYMITDLFSADVAAGKKSNEVMYLSSAVNQLLQMVECIHQHTVDSTTRVRRAVVRDMRYESLEVHFAVSYRSRIPLLLTCVFTSLRCALYFTIFQCSFYFHNLNFLKG